MINPYRIIFRLQITLSKVIFNLGNINIRYNTDLQISTPPHYQTWYTGQISTSHRTYETSSSDPRPLHYRNSHFNCTKHSCQKPAQHPSRNLELSCTTRSEDDSWSFRNPLVLKLSIYNPGPRFRLPVCETHRHPIVAIIGSCFFGPLLSTGP